MVASKEKESDTKAFGFKRLRPCWAPRPKEIVFGKWKDDERQSLRIWARRVMLTMSEIVDLKIWVGESGRMELNYDHFERCPYASCRSLWGLVLWMCICIMMMMMMMMMNTIIIVIAAIIIICSSRLNISTNTHTKKKNLTVFPCGQKGYICDSLRTDSLSLWGGDLRVQNFELRTDELARVPWSKKWVKVPGTLCFWWNDGVERVEFGTEWLQKSESSIKQGQIRFCLLYVLNICRLVRSFCRCLGSEIRSSLLEDAWTWTSVETFYYRIVVKVCNHRFALLNQIILRKMKLEMVTFKILLILIFRTWLPIYIIVYPNPPSLSVFSSFSQGPWHRCQWHRLASYTWLRAGVARGVGARYMEVIEPLYQQSLQIDWRFLPCYSPDRIYRKVCLQASRTWIVLLLQPQPDSGPRKKSFQNMKHGMILPLTRDGWKTKWNQRWSQIPWSLEPNQFLQLPRWFHGMLSDHNPCVSRLVWTTGIQP